MASGVVRRKRFHRRRIRRQFDTEDRDLLDMLLTEVNEEEAAEILGEVSEFTREDAGEDSFRPI